MFGGLIVARLQDLRVDVSLASVAQGDLLYRGASKWNNLAPGTSGQFLKTQGAAANPVWAALTSGNVTTALGFTPANLAGDTFTGLLTVNRSGAAQALFHGWDEVGGNAATSGQILLGNNAAFQGRVHYNAGVGDLYCDNSYGTAPAKNRCRVNTAAAAITGWEVNCRDGRMFILAPNSAPTDADLMVSSITPYLSEAGNQLFFRVKYADGTLKTSAALALS